MIGENMNYLLNVKQLSNIYRIKNPSSYDLQVSVYFLTFNMSNYLTYECTPSLKGIKSIRADDYDEGCVFVKVFVENSKKTDEPIVYGQRLINDDLLAMLNNFRDGVTPDLKGWAKV